MSCFILGRLIATWEREALASPVSAKSRLRVMWEEAEACREGWAPVSIKVEWSRGGQLRRNLGVLSRLFVLTFSFTVRYKEGGNSGQLGQSELGPPEVDSGYVTAMGAAP